MAVNSMINEQMVTYACACKRACVCYDTRRSRILLASGYKLLIGIMDIGF